MNSIDYERHIEGVLALAFSGRQIRRLRKLATGSYWLEGVTVPKPTMDAWECDDRRWVKRCDFALFLTLDGVRALRGRAERLKVHFPFKEVTYSDEEGDEIFSAMRSKRITVEQGLLRLEGRVANPIPDEEVERG